MDTIGLIINNFKRKKLRSWLTIIGILIGTMSIVSLIALGQGLQYAISSQFNFLGPDIITINGGGSPFGGASNPLTYDYTDLISGIDGVDRAAGRIVRPVNFVINKQFAITMGSSIPYGEERDFLLGALGLEIIEGRLPDDNKDNEIVLGNTFKEESEKRGKAIKVGQKVTIEKKEFTIVGFFNKKGSFLIDGVIYFNEKSLEKLYDVKDEYTVIAAKVKDKNNIKETIDNVEKTLRKKRGVKEYDQDFRVQSAQATLERVNGILSAVQIFVYIIAGISILVSGIGIANTMFTSVLERTKEIGIMKAIGARNSTIFILFLVESGLLGLLGGIIGASFGSGIALGLAYLGRQALGLPLIQARITIELIIGSLLFSFIIGTIFGLIPAVKASKQHPVEALNYAK